MKCDRCENEATVHEVTVQKGQKVEKHLCEKCAATDGLAIQTHAPINALLSKFVVAPTGGGEPSRPECESCGMSYAQFRQHGLLGCPACYEAFEEQIGPLLERAHEGATHHTGKTPKRSGASIDRQRTLAKLRKALNDAVAAERYEQAASIRDEIRAADSHDESDSEGDLVDGAESS